MAPGIPDGGGEGRDKRPNHAVNGQECQIYTYTSTTLAEICIAHGLPVRPVEDDGNSKTTVIFPDYNSQIDIQAPI